MPNVDLSGLSVRELVDLRTAVEDQLKTEYDYMRSAIAAIDVAMSTGSAGRKLGKVQAKYRHPETGEEWSGRGGVAGWLAREIAAGKEREDFLVASN